MQTVLPVFRGDAARDATLAVHTQAVECAIKAMHTHLQELLTLEDLASIACLSPFHFHRVFRCLVGVPPGAFLAALRLQEARRLLLSTSLSVTDICFEVGYTSLGSFTSRFTQQVGLSPRLLRQRAHAFEPPSLKSVEVDPRLASRMPEKNTLLGRISVPATFRGVVYVGLFSSPIPQGAPLRCTRLSAPGVYLLPNIPDGVYYLRAAAFPTATDLRLALLPGERMLLSNDLSPLILRHGQSVGVFDIVLRPPRLTDLPLVMGLPLL